MKILIVDDSKSSRMYLKMLLTAVLSETVEFVYAEDGEVAVDKFREHQPNLTFLDLTMPKKNGMEVLQDILAIDEEAKVIIVTADAQKISHDKAMQYGATDFINKPISEEKFQRKLQLWL